MYIKKNSFLVKHIAVYWVLKNCICFAYLLNKVHLLQNDFRKQVRRLPFSMHDRYRYFYATYLGQK